MPLNIPSIETIYNRVRADAEHRIEGSVKIPEKSVIGILIIVFSASVHLCYKLISFISKQLMPDTAEGDWLERHGKLRKVNKKAAGFATGVIQVIGQLTTPIPAGTIWQNSTNVEYTNDEDYVIDNFNQVLVTVRAVVAGESSNTLEQELFFVTPIPNVDTNADVTEDIQGGTEIESEDDYRERVVQVTQFPPSGGIETDYDRWALETVGVGKAWTFPVYQGAGTVGIVIATEDGEIVTSIIKQDCQDNIDAKGPLGIIKTVEDIEPVYVDMDISLKPNNSQTQSNVSSLLSELFDETVEPGGTILISRIRSVISSGGVEDYNINGITIDGGVSFVDNIVTAGFEYAKLQNIVWSNLV